MHPLSRRIFTLFCLATLALGPFRAAYAQQGQRLNLVRDAEIENTIRTFVTPIWRVAGLDPEGVSIVLVQDGSLNAFVAGGQRIFINTGLIIRTQRPNQLIGVMAHETGHISGGHLARMHEELSNLTTLQILEAILSGAAVAGGAATEEVLIVNVGARSTTLSFVGPSGANIQSANIGGNLLTQGVSDNTGEPFANAEAVKVGYYSGVVHLSESDPQVAVLQANSQSFIRRLSQDINRRLINVRRGAAGRQPTRILLTGRGSLVPGLAGANVAAAAAVRDAVSSALASVGAVCDLRLAVVGGSVALGFGEPFFTAAQAEIDQRARVPSTVGLRVVPAGLGQLAPLVGAAALARRALERSARRA